MSNKRLDDIDAFLHGELSESENQAFLAKMSADEALRKEVDLTRTIMLSTEALEKESFKSLIQDIHQEHTSNEVSSIPSGSKWRNILLALLLLAALIMGFYFFILDGSQQSPEEIFADHYKVEDLHLSYRSTDSSAELQTLERLFNDRQHRDFLKELTRNDAHLGNYPDLLLAKAQSEIALEDYAAAEESLDELENTPLYDRSAKWQKALLLLKLNRIDEARELLQYLSIDSDKFGNLSQRVLAKM